MGQYERRDVNERIARMSDEEFKALLDRAILILAKFESEKKNPPSELQRERTIQWLPYMKKVYDIADKIRAEQAKNKTSKK
ncbi:MAG: hypothetical protein HY063_04270 [Bacteroidetes bacterium]|nr:hypothetical protein [Bacteroidota bacterium]